MPFSIFSWLKLQNFIFHRQPSCSMLQSPAFYLGRHATSKYAHGMVDILPIPIRTADSEYSLSHSWLLVSRRTGMVLICFYCYLPLSSSFHISNGLLFFFMIRLPGNPGQSLALHIVILGFPVIPA